MLNAKILSMSKYKNTEKVKLRRKRLSGRHNENKDHYEGSCMAKESFNFLLQYIIVFITIYHCFYYNISLFFRTYL